MQDSSTGFDEQFYQAELYRHEDEAESANLLPYPTIVEVDNGELRIPGPLSFVQSSCFYTAMGCVVTVNMVALYMQLELDDDERIFSPWQLWCLNQFCLGCYIIEVLLRLAHFKGWFFFHKLDAKWNIFDIVIVMLGATDQWLLPYLVNADTKLATDKWVPALRAIRMLRLLRLVKLVGVLLRSDFRWTGSVWFNSLVSIVIVLSIVVMGCETDIESPLWEPIDSFLLGFFLFEVFVRLRRQGASFFYEEGSLWNILDFFIVVFGVFDQWLLNVWMSMVRGQQRTSELGDILLLIRMLRLLRILRLLRLVKAVRPLYLLALGVVEAMQSMFWVLVLTVVTLYTVAILMTRIVGHGAMLKDPGDVPAVTKQLFENVPASMFTLFVLMNGEEWRKVEPLLSIYPGMKIVFVVFTIFSSWALLSVMTGVVSDNMISAKKAQNQKDEMMNGERRGRIQGVLDEIFNAADAAGSGRLSKDRYYMMLDMPFYSRKVQLAVPNVSIKDLKDLFLWLDRDSNGHVGKEEFERGFLTLAEPLTGKALLYVDADVKHRFRSTQTQVSIISTELARVRMQIVGDNRKLCDMLDDEMEEDAARS